MAAGFILPADHQVRVGRAQAGASLGSKSSASLIDAEETCAGSDASKGRKAGIDEAEFRKSKHAAKKSPVLLQKWKPGAFF